MRAAAFTANPSGMNKEEMIAGFRAFCQQNGDPEIVKKYARYFKEGYNAWGLPPGLFQAKADELLASPGVTLQGVLEMADELVRSPRYEEVSLALLMTLRLHRQWNPDTFLAVERWFSAGITNWAHTDYICGEITPLMIKKGIIGMDALAGWRSAANRFQRRAAVVSLIKPMKKSILLTPYLDFITPMMMDRERVVHQGLGWFLRESWKRHPEQVEEFLLKWKDDAPRLIFQYACEKMAKEQKLRFRKSA